MTMRGALLLLMTTAVLTMAVISSPAAIGWNLRQCEKAFGKPTVGAAAAVVRRKSYEFETKDFDIEAFILGGKVSRLVFHKKSGYIDKLTVPALLAYGAPNPVWAPAYQDSDGNWHWITKSKDRFATYADNWTTFVLWTQADRDAIRTALNGDNPTLLSSVAKNGDAR
jgi:hypothetical protein